MKKTYVFLFACILIATGNVIADEGDIQSSSSNNNSSIGAGSISGSSLEEIVVTARKREESLLDIPESVVAISGDTITQHNMKTLDKIGMTVPNFNLNTRTDGWPNVTMRGLGAFSLTQGVGFYLDDIQLFGDATSRFGDLDRIEILKGPQGVLYGGSNIGGAIKFISTRPSPDETSGRLKLMVGEQNSLI
jgi:Outer membrane receptor proteins, mostly Fe transport